MRSFLVTLVLFSLILGSPSNHFPQSLSPPTGSHSKTERKTKVEVNYDKKKDLSTVRLETMILWENPDGFEKVSFEVKFTYPKRTIVTPKSVSLIFISVARYMSAFRNGELGAVLDGVRLDLGKMELPGVRNVLSSKEPLFDAVGASIPYQDFLRIAQAKKVRLEVSGNKYDLSETQIQSLNNFLQLMQQEGVEFK